MNPRMKKASSGPVTISYLQEHRVSLRWQEVVAIGLEVAEVFQRSGKRSLPREQNIELTPGGAFKLLRGRTHAGSPVSSLAAMLSSMLPKDRPTQLRLVLSTAGPDTASSKSMNEFIEALQYFERPGRRATLTEIYQRALEAPVLNEGESDETDEQKPRGQALRRRPKWLVPVAATLAVAVVATASVTLLETRSPGKITGPAGALRTAVTDAWNQAVKATAGMREAAAEDLSSVVDRVREVTEEMKDSANERLDEEETESSVKDAEDAGPSTSRRRPTGQAPLAELPAEPTTVVVDAEEAPVALDPEPASDDAVVAGEGELLMAAVFDSSHVNVTPPVTERVQLSVVGEKQPWNETGGIVEAIVSEAGEVERVRLVSEPRSIHQSMLLSAIKTWRFRPARREGTAVRYRHLISVAVHR